ncbi:uncharacterized protein LOC119459659 [Dermacentor silvarum]|uniref:uncharacterized protein LOC119459659 n=1 Tax=Dermacentor silvarum TaxID=543639 RepID=UPI0018987D26|nr:uncharacterized protein LOC119459659 [Dermacentor silvarum]
MKPVINARNSVVQCSVAAITILFFSELTYASLPSLSGTKMFGDPTRTTRSGFPAAPTIRSSLPAIANTLRGVHWAAQSKAGGVLTGIVGALRDVKSTLPGAHQRVTNVLGPYSGDVRAPKELVSFLRDAANASEESLWAVEKGQVKALSPERVNAAGKSWGQKEYLDPPANPNQERAIVDSFLMAALSSSEYWPHVEERAWYNFFKWPSERNKKSLIEKIKAAAMPAFPFDAIKHRNRGPLERFKSILSG